MCPIPSHKIHYCGGTAVPLCHTNPEPGNQMTFPAISSCMPCNAGIAKGTPSTIKLAGIGKIGAAATVGALRDLACLAGKPPLRRSLGGGLQRSLGLRISGCKAQVAKLSLQ